MILYEFCRYTKRHGIRSIVDQPTVIQSIQQKNHLYRSEFCYPVHLTPLFTQPGNAGMGLFRRLNLMFTICATPADATPDTTRVACRNIRKKDIGHCCPIYASFPRKNVIPECFYRGRESSDLWCIGKSMTCWIPASAGMTCSLFSIFMSICSSKSCEHSNNSVNYILETIMWDSSGYQAHAGTGTQVRIYFHA